MILLRRLEARAFKRLDGIDLAFPARGAVLIEGLNESGKSTLLEAIYFCALRRAACRRGRPGGASDLAALRWARGQHHADTGGGRYRTGDSPDTHAGQVQHQP